MFQSTPSRLLTNSRRLFAVFIIGGFGLLVGVMIYLFLPRAEIVIQAADEPLTTNLTVKLDREIKRPLSNLAVLPAMVIEATQQGELTVAPPAPPEEKALSDLRAKTPTGWRLLDNLIYLETSQNMQGNQLIKIVRVIGLIFKTSEMQSLIDRHLTQATPANREVINTAADEVTYSVETYKPEFGQAVVAVNLKKITRPKFDFEKIRRDLVKKDLNAAQEYLKGLDGVTGVKIELFHCWQNKLPLVAGRIRIKLETS